MGVGVGVWKIPEGGISELAENKRMKHIGFEQTDQ